MKSLTLLIISAFLLSLFTVAAAPQPGLCYFGDSNGDCFINFVDLKTAQKLKLRNGQKISAKINSKNAVTFHNILVRIDKNFKTRIHLNTDEGNAAGIKQATTGKLLI